MDGSMGRSRGEQRKVRSKDDGVLQRGKRWLTERRKREIYRADYKRPEDSSKKGHRVKLVDFVPLWTQKNDKMWKKIREKLFLFKLYDSLQSSWRQ